MKKAAAYSKTDFYRSASQRGLYVFRSMHTVSQNVEIGVLSEQTATRRDGNYVAEPVGLFQPEGPDDRCAMWLLTWYDG